MPDKLNSDMGSQNEAEINKELSQILQIRKTHTTPHHLQSDGLVDRLNRTIYYLHVGHCGEWCRRRLGGVSALGLFHIQHQWTGINGLFTPFYLMFGRQARIPLDLMFRTPVNEIRSPICMDPPSISTGCIWTSPQELSYRPKDFYAEEFMGNLMRLVI